MKIQIHTKEGSLRMTAAADDNARATCGIQQESLLSVSFTAFECVTVEVYDYVDFEGARYWATERYRPQMNARREWAYTLQLHGIEGLAAQTLMVNPTDGKDDPIVMLTAPAREHAALIVANLNRKMQTTDWKVGEVVVSEYLDIDYTGKYASDALSELSAAANTEWWFDGTTLNITRCEYGDPIPLAYGNGLVGEITPSVASGVKFFTRLFPVGSSRNIDPDAYGHARLQLPGGETYVEQDTHLGIVEHYEQEAFEEIYPRRVGRVGSVRHETRTGEDGEPFTIWYFTDPELPFDPNDYAIGGLVKQVTFQSGELRGRTFEVNYDSRKREFEIITQWPYDNGMQLPAAPMVPGAGDEYVLWNIRMPESYYRAAEAEFYDAVLDFMRENRKDVAEYRAKTDFTVVAQRALDLKPGQRVRLESREFFPGVGYKDTRIVSIDRPVNEPGSMTLTLSDVLAKGRLSRIESDIVQVRQMTREVQAEFPEIVRSWENTPASDFNLFSSKRSMKEFLSKRLGGTVEAPVCFARDVAAGGSIVSDDFRRGDFAGAGFGLYKDENGNAVCEADILKVRKEAVFNEAVINQVTFRTGATVFSNGGCEVTRIEERDDAFRCFYDNKDGRRFSGLVAGDQVRCQRYDATQRVVIKYYWRLVTAVGEDYVDLSKTDADGSGVPAAGDQIAQFGNRTDRTRRSAIVLDPQSGGSVVVFAGIDSFTISRRNCVGMGVDPQSGESYLYGYGDMFFGDRDPDEPDATFITFQQRAGEARKRLHVQAAVTIGAGSTGLGNLSEWAGKQQEIDAAQDTANSAAAAAAAAARAAQQAQDYLDNTLPGELGEINKRLDGVVENWFQPYTPTRANDPAKSWLADGSAAQHQGDTFTNTQAYIDDATTPDAGKSWRWVENGAGYYDWMPIADSDAVKALQAAAQAQDTADQKRRIFVVRPTTPYDVGDMWTQGEAGQIMRCVKARAAGAFAAEDWAPAADYYKYTDGKVDGLQIGGVNYWPASEAEVEGNKGQWSLRPIPAELKQQLHVGDWVMVQCEATASSRVLCSVTMGGTENGNWTAGDGAEGEWTGNFFCRRITTQEELDGDISVACYLSNSTGRTRRRFCGIGNKAVSWRPAQADIDAKIKAAQQAADEARKHLSDWASDALISPPEKGALKQQQRDIAAEYAQVAASAAEYGIATTDYAAAYAAADRALSKYTADAPENIPVGADYADIAAYYAARTSILDAVAAASKKYSETLVGDLRIGGVNLITTRPENWEVNSISQSKPAGTTWAGIVYRSTGWVRPRELVAAQGTVTMQAAEGFMYALLEFDADGGYMGLAQGYHSSLTGVRTFALLPETRYVGVILKDTALTVQDVGILERARFKIESGDKATDWTSAPEDDAPRHTEGPDAPRYPRVGDTWTYEGLTQTWYAGSKGWVTTGDQTGTVIDNGLITSGTIQLGDASAVAKAGITGAGNSDDSVRIWAGSAATGMNTAPFQVLQSGKVRASNAEIKGYVEATSGKIAGFNIEGSSMIQSHSDHGLAVEDMTLTAWGNAGKTARVFLTPIPDDIYHPVIIEAEEGGAAISGVIEQRIGGSGSGFPSHVAVFYADYLPAADSDAGKQKIYAFYAPKGDIVTVGGRIVGRQCRRTTTLATGGQLPNAAVGSRILLAHTTAATIYLPPISSLEPGDSIEFVSTTNMGGSLRDSDRKSIIVHQGTASDVFKLPAYARAELVFYNGKWIVIE